MKPRQLFSLVLLIMIILVFTVAATKEDSFMLRADFRAVASNESLLVLSDKEEIDIDKMAILSTVALPKTNRLAVYAGLSLSELGEQLNRSMKGVLAGKGHYFAAKSLELGIDPHMALAISLHETGCNWNCSHLARVCYNIGGQKGRPGCGGGAYKRFNSLDEGIDGFLYNLHNNYIKYGLTTPEKINPKYAENPLWYQKVRLYMKQIASK